MDLITKLHIFDTIESYFGLQIVADNFRFNTKFMKEYEKEMLRRVEIVLKKRTIDRGV